MKKFLFLLILLISSLSIYSQNLKPYILAGKSSESISAVEKTVKEKMTAAGLEVVGKYYPISSKDRVVIAFTSDELKNAAKKVGGFKGFALVLLLQLKTVKFL